MSKSAWQRTGAFVGTVTAVALVAKTVRPSRGPAVIDAAGNVFRNSLYAAMGGSYPKDGLTTNDLTAQVSTLPDPFAHRNIKYWLWSLFPQVPTPFQLETWEQAACRIYDFAPETWEDAEYLAELVHQLKCECGTDGV